MDGERERLDGGLMKHLLLESLLVAGEDRTSLNFVYRDSQHSCVLAHVVYCDVTIYCLVCRPPFRPNVGAGVLLVAYFHLVAEMDYACRCSSTEICRSSREHNGAPGHFQRLVSMHPWW